MSSRMDMPEWQGILNDTDLGGLSFQDSVLETPPVAARAGLYVYLNAMLHNKPSFDDTRATKFLHARYDEDVPTLVSDLILASFDVLANAISRNEPLRSRTIIRSFIVNKLTIFIQNHYSGMIFEPLSTEHCIRQALGRIDPLSSQSFDMLSETRQDFLFACALHDLLPESSIEDILGDVPMQSLPASGRYSKEELVSQCTTDTFKIDQYVSELENTEGNSGAIAGAIVDIMHSLCANNDTMTLKGICNSLSRRPMALDVMLLFTQSDTLLRPFCHILDHWQDHEDQGEYQPVYDEFGSILLFIAAVQHRFNLNPAEMGIDAADSFVTQYLRSSSSSGSIDKLSHYENDLLGSWIKGLFETEGISDELMSACKPNRFHLLVATLFDQSLKACRAGMLAMETLKGGLEYLLEPFLLPSLVAGLKWLADRLWELNIGSPDIEVLMQALHALLKPPRMSQESSLIHGAVLQIVARRLETEILHLQQQCPSRGDTKPLLGALAPYTADNDGKKALEELAAWSVSPKGALLAALRNSIQALALWSATAAASTDMSPPSFTFHQLLSTLEIKGAYVTLESLIDEMQSANITDMAMDVSAVMILAVQHKQPSDNQDNGPRPIRLPMNLHNVLQARYDAASELSKTDSARASVIVRLYRRVEAFSGQIPVIRTENGGFGQATAPHVGDGHGTEIDDVLAEAEVQTAAAQEFLSGEHTSLMGMADAAFPLSIAGNQWRSTVNVAKITAPEETPSISPKLKCKRVNDSISRPNRQPAPMISYYCCTVNKIQIGSGNGGALGIR
ncbi:MAG: hypothetical protein Q9217_006168 [Psora testacea]